MKLQEENEIIEKSKKNPAEFGAIFDKYYPAIFRYLLHRTGNAAIAADITSETFFKALNKLSSYTFKGYPFSSWLYKIAGNESNMYFRKKKYEPASYEAAIGEQGVVDIKNNIENEMIEVQNEIEKNNEFLEVKKELYKLPIKYQEVIVLRFFENKKISEIATILGKREGTIKSLISRGLSKLRAEMDRNSN